MRSTSDDVDWTDFLARYDTVVLVGNSGVLSGRDLSAFESPKSLFVFFNDVRRSLDAPFNRDSIVMLRCGPDGPNVVQSKNMKKILSLFMQDRLKAVVQFRVAASEKVTDITEKIGRDWLIVDRVHAATPPYPTGKIPTSGFAAIDWLLDIGFAGRIVTAGFSGVRSHRATLYIIHSWQYEQAALRMYERRGLVSAFPSLLDGDPIRALLKKRFPDASDLEISDDALIFQTARQDAGDEMLNKVWGATRSLRKSRAFFKVLKSIPRSILRFVRR